MAVTVSAGRRAGRAQGLRSARPAAVLFAPAGLVLIALVLVPLIFLVLTSFTDFNRRSLFTGAYNSVGLSQYTQIFGDQQFWMALLRTFGLTAALVAGSMGIGMAVAEMMLRIGSVLRYVVTVVMILAWAMPNVASSLVWNWLFSPGYGVINWMLTQLRIFGDVTNLAWSNNTWLAFTSIWLLIVWQAVPFLAMTIYASRTQLDESVLEAAALDGAGPVRAYWSMIVPLMRPTLVLVGLLSVIWDFNVFNQIWLVSQGGPGNSTSTLGVWTYKRAFVGFDLGQGAAISVVTTIILLGITSLYIRRLLRSGEDL